jgi:hypothetical protein
LSHFPLSLHCFHSGVVFWSCWLFSDFFLNLFTLFCLFRVQRNGRVEQWILGDSFAVV